MLLTWKPLSCKIALAGLFTTIATSNFAQELDIEIQFSKHNAVLVFLEQLAASSENEFKSEYEKSIFKTTENDALISEFGNLDVYFSHKRFKSTEQFQSICIKSQSWTEVRNRAIGLFPERKLHRLVNLLRHFDPIYDAIVYEPSSAFFEKQLDSISSLLAEGNLPAFFYKAMKFYGAAWDMEVPLIVSFYPIPHAYGSRTMAYGNTVTSGIPLSFNDLDGTLSVIIHEACHLLNYGKSDKIDHLMDSVFFSSTANSSQYAYWLFDEASATSIGNGAFFKELTGELDTNDWYYHKYIDLMAKKMLPLIRGYLEEGKTIDEDFVAEYIAIYEGNFSHWLGELAHLMTYSSTMASDKKTGELVRSKFRYSNIVSRLYPVTTESIQKWRTYKVTKVLLITENNEETVKNTLAAFPEITTELDAEKDFIFNGLLENKSQLIILNSMDSDIESLIDELITIENIGTAFHVRYY